MRSVAVLVIAAGSLVGGGVQAAEAATYCAGGPVWSANGCAASTAGIQEALDAASARPGPDIVLIAGGTHRPATGLVYSDRGAADNGIVVDSGGRCERYGCETTTLAGGAPGETLLAFGGGGGAAVAVNRIGLEPGPGVTALSLPPGAEAHLQVNGEDGSVGVRAEGTPARPVLLGGGIYQPLGGATDIAIDAVGAVTVERAYIQSDVAARSGGSAGVLTIRDASMIASVGVTGRRAHLERGWLELRPRPGTVVGFEAVCPNAGAPDAEVSLENVTLRGAGEPGTAGARAIGRGGDGDSCRAAVRLNSSILHGVETSLEAVGDAGSGADPRDGVAAFDLDYSNYDDTAIRQAGPTAIDMSSPGGNVTGDPRFNPVSAGVYLLNWDSPLIDRGDPAPLEEWQNGWYATANGRRDIGFDEYQFEPPRLDLILYPPHAVRPGTDVSLAIFALDRDVDPLHVRVELADGEVREYSVRNQNILPIARRYMRPGTYVERATVTDPTGRSAAAEVAIEVRRQRMLRLSVTPRRFRAGRGPGIDDRAKIRFRTSVPGEVRFRVERRVRRARGRGFRWARTRHRFTLDAFPGTTIHPFNGWLLTPDGRVGNRPLRPGLYRLVAAPRGVRPLRARFRIIR